MERYMKDCILAWYVFEIICKLETPHSIMSKYNNIYTSFQQQQQHIDRYIVSTINEPISLSLINRKMGVYQHFVTRTMSKEIGVEGNEHIK